MPGNLSVSGYLDTAYLAKIYVEEPGSSAVEALVESLAERFTSEWTWVELHSVFHRYLREEKMTAAEVELLIGRAEADRTAGVWTFIPLDHLILENAATAYRTLRPNVFLRASDCLHLITAQRHRISAFYSSDRQLLRAAREFGLTGINVI
jgi:predicted nucleic acid-binding protein